MEGNTKKSINIPLSLTSLEPVSRKSVSKDGIIYSLLLIINRKLEGDLSAQASEWISCICIRLDWSEHNSSSDLKERHALVNEEWTYHKESEGFAFIDEQLQLNSSSVEESDISKH